MNDEIDQRLHVYDSFVKKYQDAIDIFDKLFIIKEENISEIEKLIKDVEQILFKKYKFTVKDVINAIDTAFFIRKKYLKLYWTILNLVIDKFHTDNISDYIYELVSDEFKELYRTKFEFLEYKSYDQIFHDNLPKSNIDLSILNDDLESLRSFIPPSDNEELMKTHLLEDCCFYGSVNCFYFILQNTNALINRRCLEKSFIGGNNDIINECLKYEKPTEICMANAIGSHIIENVLFLENKYGLKVDSDTASSNYNLHAFIIAIDRNIGTSKCISSCLASGIPSLSEFLIEFNADVNAKNENETIPLYSSIDRNDEETTNLLIEYGAYLNIPDEYNNLPLFHAVYENKIQSVKALLDNGIDINMRNRHGKSPIHCAACFNLTEMILFLLENGSEINSIDDWNKTPLHYSIESDKYESAKLLLEKGCNVNCLDKQSQTPLHLCVIKENYEMCKLLIKYGSNLEIKNNNQMTPFLESACHNNNKIFHFLIDQGSNINAQTDDGQSSIILASLGNFTNYIEILHEHGLDLNHQDKYGNTALHYASEYNYKQTVILLLKLGAKYDIINNNGMTAIQVADFHNHFKIKKIISKFIE